MDTSLIIIVFTGIAAAALSGAIVSLCLQIQSSPTEKRLAAILDENPAKDRQIYMRAETWRDRIDELASRLGSWEDRVRQCLTYYEQAYLPVSLPYFLVIVLAISVVCAGTLFLISEDARMSFASALIGATLPWGWVIWSRNSRLKRFNAQFPEALDLLSRAMRSGQSLVMGMRAISDELLPPVTEEFRRVCDAISLGNSTEAALQTLLHRVPTNEVRFFVTAVQINIQSGGNLTDVLGKISNCMRERFRIEGQLQALTGEGRISGLVLMALPIAFFAAIFVLNPDYVSPLFEDPIGKQLLIGAIVLQAIGAVVIRKMVKIDL